MSKVSPLALRLALALISATSLGAAASQATPAAQAQPKAPPAAKPTLPAAVAAAFKAAYPRATIKGFSKEGAEYEIESMDGTQARDLIYKADATLVSYEEATKEADVPAAVISAIKARYPKASFTTFEKMFDGKTKAMNYEVVIKNAGKTLELELTPAGMWISPKPAK
jgi:hypothetical protein